MSSSIFQSRFQNAFAESVDGYFPDVALAMIKSIPSIQAFDVGEDGHSPLSKLVAGQTKDLWMKALSDPQNHKHEAVKGVFEEMLSQYPKNEAQRENIKNVWNECLIFEAKNTKMVDAAQAAFQNIEISPTVQQSFDHYTSKMQGSKAALDVISQSVALEMALDGASPSDKLAMEQQSVRHGEFLASQEIPGAIHELKELAVNDFARQLGKKTSGPLLSTPEALRELVRSSSPDPRVFDAQNQNSVAPNLAERIAPLSAHSFSERVLGSREQASGPSTNPNANKMG